MIIKRAQVFRLDIEDCDQSKLTECLNLRPARENLADLEISFSGFCQHPVSGEFVTPIGKDDLVFCVRTEEKVIPTSAVKLKAEQIESEMRDLFGVTLTRKHRAEAKERAMLEMLPAAFVKRKITFCYYSPSQKILLIDTASRGTAATIMRLLVEVLGSVKTSTIHIDGIKQSLAAKLRDSLNNNQSTIGQFKAGDKINLVGMDGEVVQYKGIDPINQVELLSHLSAGYQIDKISLVDGVTTFNLHSDFRLSGISFDFVADFEEVDDDEAGMWRIKAGTEFTLLMGVVNGICDLFMSQNNDLIGGDE